MSGKGRGTTFSKKGGKSRSSTSRFDEGNTNVPFHGNVPPMPISNPFIQQDNATFLTNDDEPPPYNSMHNISHPTTYHVYNTPPNIHHTSNFYHSSQGVRRPPPPPPPPPPQPLLPHSAPQLSIMNSQFEAINPLSHYIRQTHSTTHISTPASSNHSNPFQLSHDTDSSQTSSHKKTFIQPTATRFVPNHVAVVRAITSIVHSKFDGPYSCWKKVPQDLRDLWFAEFQKLYCWNLEDQSKIKTNFCNHVKCGLKNAFNEARKDFSKRPHWISQENWDKLVQYWKSDEFQTKSSRNKKNRASDTGVGSSLHTGGSIPIEEHARRLAKQAGGKVAWDEVYKHTHQRRKDKTWVDSKSSDYYEKFEKHKAEYCSSQGSIGNTNDGNRDDEVIESTELATKSDLEIWKEVVGLTKKGQLYGFGPMGSAEIKSSSSSGTSSKRNVPFTEDPEFQKYMASEQHEKEQLKKEWLEYKKKTDELGKLVLTLFKKVGGSNEINMVNDEHDSDEEEDGN